MQMYNNYGKSTTTTGNVNSGKRMTVCSMNFFQASFCISLVTFDTSTYLVIPLLVAMMRMGAMSLSKARFKNEKHSISSM